MKINRQKISKYFNGFTVKSTHFAMALNKDLSHYDHSNFGSKRPSFIIVKAVNKTRRPTYHLEILKPSTGYLVEAFDGINLSQLVQILNNVA